MYVINNIMHTIVIYILQLVYIYKSRKTTREYARSILYCTERILYTYERLKKDDKIKILIHHDQPFYL